MLSEPACNGSTTQWLWPSLISHKPAQGKCERTKCSNYYTLSKRQFCNYGMIFFVESFKESSKSKLNTELIVLLPTCFGQFLPFVIQYFSVMIGMAGVLRLICYFCCCWNGRLVTLELMLCCCCGCCTKIFVSGSSRAAASFLSAYSNCCSCYFRPVLARTGQIFYLL